MLHVLPASQRRLWPELSTVPEHFTLYGGTALALRLGHRQSADFDFFSNEPFDPDVLASHLPLLQHSERIQVSANKLTCRIERDDPVLVSFFGALQLGCVHQSDRTADTGLNVASLLDIAGTKAAVVQKRAETKDYLDIAALLQNGVDLPTALAAAGIVYGEMFNPVITLKALSYFDDVPDLPVEVRNRLTAAVVGTDPNLLPILSPYRARPNGNGTQP
jgi:Nucleotidyl transferase AbiEii toxin, Type IV TA system